MGGILPKPEGPNGLLPEMLNWVIMVLNLFNPVPEFWLLMIMLTPPVPTAGTKLTPSMERPNESAALA